MSFEAVVIGILVFALLGFLVYLIVTFIPMPEPFKQAIIVGCVVLIVLYLLAILTGHSSLPVFFSARP